MMVRQINTRRKENEEVKSMEKFFKRNDKEASEGTKEVEWFHKIKADIIKIKKGISHEGREW